MSDPNSGGVQVSRGARSLSPDPESEKLVRLDEAMYQLPDGTVKPGLQDDESALQVYPAGATVTAGQASEWGLTSDVDAGKLEAGREQHADYMGGSAVVDAGAVSAVRVDGSTSAALEGESAVQTAADVDQRVRESIQARQSGEQPADAQAAEREATQSAERQTAAERRATAKQTES